jgi:hypothetical protein
MMALRWSSIFKDKYGKFKMMKDESVPEMFHRLNVILNELWNLGHKVDDEDFSHQFLRCLPCRFDTLVTIIVRGSLKGVTPTQILGDVVTQDTYHVEREGVDNEDDKKKSVAFKATTSSKNKVKKKEESSDDDEGSSSNEEDEDMTPFVCQFGKFMKKKGYGARRRRSSSKRKE